MTQTATIDFPAKWISSSTLESTLRSGPDVHRLDAQQVHYRFPAGCKIMIDAAVRLLSLFNQLDTCCKRVLLNFEEGEFGVMGYLNRMGFFDHLAPGIEVYPDTANPILSPGPPM
ncbi:hypothetical protein JWJ90_15770 [Desulfobulbus rhabdoformis]|uniref:hypothetical protein n=1 Tax=Desulfobulbus rhabdoformis TaxID=34032 RepID=UPI0019652380|nr:hypothetical protein [Desulfobulbus rhabdoformis]MBM9615727.1 hypothetical protein [Desulfobulbus rhabdoformis]